jgi:hypothetical protein
MTEQDALNRAEALERKNTPVFTGCINYFPDAIREVAKLSLRGNNQHHPEKPLHWDKNKSNDHKDALMRHLMDDDLVAVAWRSLAALQTKLEKEK